MSDQEARVLVVDDDPLVADSIRRALAKYFTTERVTSVAEAISRTASPPAIDVVVCDLMMPDGGAPEWLEYCERAAPILGGKTLIVTGGATNDAASRFVEGKRGRVFEKPVNVPELRDAILRVLQSSDD